MSSQSLPDCIGNHLSHERRVASAGSIAMSSSLPISRLPAPSQSLDDNASQPASFVSGGGGEYSWDIPERLNPVPIHELLEEGQTNAGQSASTAVGGQGGECSWNIPGSSEPAPLHETEEDDVGTSIEGLHHGIPRQVTFGVSVQTDFSPYDRSDAMTVNLNDQNRNFAVDASPRQPEPSSRCKYLPIIFFPPAPFTLPVILPIPRFNVNLTAAVKF